MKNDPIRIQSTQEQSIRRPEQGRSTRLASSELRLQESALNETYSDGYIDYTHELW